MVTGSKLFPVLIGFGGLAFGVLFVFLGLKLWNSSIALARHGITSESQVLKKLRKEEGATWGGLENYFVRLGYTTPSGEKLETELKLNSKVWRRLDEGERFAISYLPSAPSRIYAGPVWGHKTRCGIAVVLILFGVAALCVFPVGAIRELIRSR